MARLGDIVIYSISFAFNMIDSSVSLRPRKAIKGHQIGCCAGHRSSFCPASLAGNSDADSFLRHNAPSPLTVQAAAKHWAAVRAALEADVNSDVDDLIHGESK
jgi:hypothetical protein